MVGIKQISSYVPAKRISNFSRQTDFNIDGSFILDKLGVEHVSRKADDEETSDLCIKAWKGLQQKISVEVQDIECLIVCTQTPDGYGIPQTSSVVHGKLDMPYGCAVFDVSLGCSGYVYCLSVMKGFMETNNFKTGVLFTAESYSRIIDNNDKGTALLFGDAATATLLKESGVEETPLWVPGPFLFGSKGQDRDVLHNQNGRLTMNGRAVFNFALTQVPAQINELLRINNLGQDDVDLMLLHQGSRYMVDHLRKRLKLSKEKVPINLADQGNTGSSSIPLLFEEYLDRDDIKTVVMSGFGIGLSWSSCLVKRGNVGE